MSEYQYYEFQAVDRPLTWKQMEELRGYSTRAQITPSSFINVYNYGDFKGDPQRLVGEYFDAFLYLANWGTRWLMLRVPRRLLDPKTAAAYGTGDGLSIREQGDHVILSFRSEHESDCDWAEGEGRLSSLVPVRAALMRGDHRALYLGWLLGVQGEEVGEHAREPTVPPGLGELDASLALLADFLRIDTDLITAAAEHSSATPNTSPSKKELVDWISKLPGKAKDTLLAKLIGNDDPLLVVELQRQAIDAARDVPSSSPAARRTVADLLERARFVREARTKREAAVRAREKASRDRAAAKRRKRRLESLRGKETAVWSKIHQLIGTRQPKRYNEAVSLLRDLRDWAEMQRDATAFRRRMAALRDEHARKRTLVERFRKARLVD